MDDVEFKFWIYNRQCASLQVESVKFCMPFSASSSGLTVDSLLDKVRVLILPTVLGHVLAEWFRTHTSFVKKTRGLSDYSASTAGLLLKKDHVQSASLKHLCLKYSRTETVAVPVLEVPPTSLKKVSNEVVSSSINSWNVCDWPFRSFFFNGRSGSSETQHELAE